MHLKLHLDVSISSLFSLSSSSFPLHPSLPSLLTCVFLFFFHQWGQLHQNKIYQNKHQPVAAFHLGSWASGGLSESLCELGHTFPRVNMKLNWTNTHILLCLATSPYPVSYKYSSSEWLPLSCLLQSASPFQVYGFEFADMSEHSPQDPLQLYKSISGGTHRLVQGRPLRQRWVKDVTSFPPNPRNRADRRKSNPQINFLFSLMVEMYLKTRIALWRQGKGVRREPGGSCYGQTRTPCMQELGRKQIHFSNWWTGSWTPSCWVFPSWVHTLCETSHEWWTVRASTGKISGLCELAVCPLCECHHAGPNIVRLRLSGMGIGYNLRRKGQVVSALNFSRKGRNGFRKYKEAKRQVREKKFYVRFATGGFTFKIHSNKTKQERSIPIAFMNCIQVSKPIKGGYRKSPNHFLDKKKSCKRNLLLSTVPKESIQKGLEIVDFRCIFQMESTALIIKAKKYTWIYRKPVIWSL